MFHSAKPRAWPQLYPRLTVRVPPPESELSPTDQAAIIATFFLPSEAKARTSSQHSLAPSGSNRNLSLFMQQHLKSMQREAEEALESLRWRSSQLASTVRSSASSMKRVSSSMVQLVAQAMVPKVPRSSGCCGLFSFLVGAVILACLRADIRAGLTQHVLCPTNLCNKAMCLPAPHARHHRVC